jgi:hypothetical protein
VWVIHFIAPLSKHNIFLAQLQQAMSMQRLDVVLHAKKKRNGAEAHAPLGKEKKRNCKSMSNL